MVSDLRSSVVDALKPLKSYREASTAREANRHLDEAIGRLESIRSASVAGPHVAELEDAIRYVRELKEREGETRAEETETEEAARTSPPAERSRSRPQPQPGPEPRGKTSAGPSDDECPTDFVVDSEANKTTWDDIVGMESEKELIRQRIVLPIRYPALFRSRGITTVNIMLYGPGGTGKTSLLKAAATELNMPLFIVKASDIKGKFVGQAEKCLRKAFNAARAEPNGAILFFDEAESVLGSTGMSGEQNASAIAEFKAQVQGADNVVVVAATNHPWQFEDSALLRRFQARVYVDLPNADDRWRLLRHFAGKETDCNGSPMTLPFEEEQVERLKLLTNMMTPAELEELVKQSLGTGDVGPFNVESLYFCPRGDGTYDPVPADRVGLSDIGRCYRIENLPPEDQRRICWPDLTFGSFLEVLRRGDIKRATSEEGLRRFLQYAKDIQDEKNVARIEQSLEQFAEQEGQARELVF